MADMLVNSSSDFDVLASMRHQEKTKYNNKVDYLAEAKNKGIEVRINQERRRTMAQIMYQTCKNNELSNEVVEVAMNMFDRFLATPAGVPALERGQTYLLAAVTCFYTAAKAHETKVTDPEPQMISPCMFHLIRGHDIVEMESIILPALQYRVHPPTPTSFVRLYLNVLTATMMIPSLMDPLYNRTVLEASTRQIKEAMSLHQFVTVPASVIGYCCLMNSLEATGMLDDMNVRTNVVWFLRQFVFGLKAADFSEYSRLVVSAISGIDYRLSPFRSSKGSKSKTVVPCETTNESPKSVRT
jgi:hypothetical protein